MNPSQAPKTTFTRLHPDKQSRILEVALEEFGRRGYQRASINTMVQRLGIAKGSIFQYFGDKQGLFRFVFDQAIDKVKEELRGVRAATGSQDLFTRLEQTLAAGVNFLHRHPKIYALYLRMLYESGIPLRRELLGTLRAYSLEYLSGLLQEAQLRGEVRTDIAPDRLALFLDALMDRFLQTQAVRHLDAGMGLYQMDPHRSREWILDMVDFIRRGIADRPAPIDPD